MTHPDDDEYEINEPFSSPCSAPSLEPVSDQPGEDEKPTVSHTPANENIVPAGLVQSNEQAERAFERQAEESFRMAIGGNAESVRDFYDAATEAYEATSNALRTSATELTTAIAQLNWKLLEFGRSNVQSNLDYVRDVSTARNVRDLVDAQTAYMRGQYDALTRQMRELQTLTTELAGKTAAPFKEQFTRVTQLPRIC